VLLLAVGAVGGYYIPRFLQIVYTAKRSGMALQTREREREEARLGLIMKLKLTLLLSIGTVIKCLNLYECIFQISSNGFVSGTCKRLNDVNSVGVIFC